MRHLLDHNYFIGKLSQFFASPLLSANDNNNGLHFWGFLPLFPLEIIKHIEEIVLRYTSYFHTFLYYFQKINATDPNFIYIEKKETLSTISTNICIFLMLLLVVFSLFGVCGLHNIKTYSCALSNIIIAVYIHTILSSLDIALQTEVYVKFHS